MIRERQLPPISHSRERRRKAAEARVERRHRSELEKALKEEVDLRIRSMSLAYDMSAPLEEHMERIKRGSRLHAEAANRLARAEARRDRDVRREQIRTLMHGSRP